MHVIHTHIHKKIIAHNARTIALSFFFSKNKNNDQNKNI